jgi:HEAT repeat protein
MSFRARALVSLRRLAGAIGALLASIDSALVALARPFGAEVAAPLNRYGILLGAYAGLYLLALLPVPWLALVVLLLGYLGVVAIGRAWVANEKQRARIVKKLENTNPDTLPDLRVSALLAAAQLLVLFPLLFDTLHRLGPGLFKVSPETEASRGQAFASWFAFTLDAISRSLVQYLGLKERAESVGRGNAWGGSVILLARTTIDLLLVQGIVRLIAIRSLVSEAVSALKQDPDIPRRLGRRAVGPLLVLLQGPDKDLREKASLVLGELKDPRAIDGLVAALQDPEPDVRWRAATALGQIGDPSAVGGLVDGLRDEEETVRTAALHSLTALAGPDALAHLMALYDESEPVSVRAAAIEGLGQMPDAEAGKVLLSALRDSSEEVRKSAVIALGRRKDQRATEALIQVLAAKSNPPWLRGESARALEQLGAAAALPELLRGTEDEDAFVRKCCARALGALHDEQAVPALVALLPAAEKDVREAAAAALGKLKAKAAVPDLVPLLEDGEEPVREAAAQALAEIGDASAVGELARVSRDGTVPARQLAVEVLGKLGGEAAVEAVIAALRDEDKEVRETAVWALGEVGDERAVGPLEAARKDGEASVRDGAEEALKKIGKRREALGTS